MDFMPFGARLNAGLFLQGMMDGVFCFVIPLASLSLTTGEFEVGLLLALFALGGAGGALAVARLSDRTGERVRFVRIGALVTLPLFLLVALLPNIFVFVICLGISYFSLHLSWIFLMTLAVDRNERHSPTALLTREFQLNFGRSMGILALAAIWLFWMDLYLGFVVMALAIGASAVTK
jgi:MFS family permease